MSAKPTLLPPNASGIERDIADVIAFTADPTALATLNSPRHAPAQFLPVLAWSLSVDEWDETWPESTRRQVVAESINVHRSKGTVASVERILRSVGLIDEARGYTVEIIEGMAQASEAGQNPPHWAEYSIVLTRPITINQAALTRRLLASVTPARCHLRSLDFRGVAWLRNGQARYNAQITHGVA